MSASSVSRRQFLSDSLLAAAAAAAMPAAHALAAEASQPVKKFAHPLQVAIVGVGGRGVDHVRAYLANPDTEIAYVVEVDESIGRRRVEEIARQQSRPPKFARDLRTALDDKSVDVVSTATPNHWHALCAIWAMQAGKDVYVEKPVSHNVSEGRRMVQAARKHNRICQTGTQCRSMRATIEAVQYVRSGKIGEVKLARGLCYKRRPSIGPKGEYRVPPQVDYNLWAGPARMLPLTRPKFHYDWHWQREWGNGDMGNQGPHQMDIARWGLGIDRLAERVLCFGGRLGYRDADGTFGTLLNREKKADYEDAGDVANTEVALFDCGEKTIVFEVRGLDTDPLRGARVGNIFYGTNGYVVLDTYTTGAAFDLKGKLVKRFNGGGDHFANFIEAVRARDPKMLRADILEGHLSCAHSHLANVSYYLGKPALPGEIKQALDAWKNRDDVADLLDRTLAHLKTNGVDIDKTPLTLGPELSIDVEGETVRDNPAAVALLTRSCRAPFIVPAAEDV